MKSDKNYKKMDDWSDSADFEHMVKEHKKSHYIVAFLIVINELKAEIQKSRF